MFGQKLELLTFHLDYIGVAILTHCFLQIPWYPFHQEVECMSLPLVSQQGLVYFLEYSPA